MITVDESGTHIKGQSEDILNEFYNILEGLTTINGFEVLMLMTATGTLGCNYPDLEPLIKDIAWAFLKNKSSWHKEKEENGDE